MLKQMLDHAASVAIGGHVRPDGDCVGSCMGLYRYLKDNYEELAVDVYLEEIPAPFTFIKETREILHELPKGKKYDLFICLDCGDEDRLGFAKPLFLNAKKTFCIDHHISNKAFAQENYIFPDASSTSELVYRLIDKDKITKEIAEALYMGIAHDTGVFQYSSASPETFRAAADLLGCGIDAPTLINATYYEKTYVQNQVLGRALLESALFLDGKCIVSVLTKELLDFYGADSKDMEGIVSQLRVTKGVEAAVFAYEQEPQTLKVSLRSKNRVDVSKVAQYFGGGGHVRAAGCTVKGTVSDVVDRLVKQIGIQLTGTDEE